MGQLDVAWRGVSQLDLAWDGVSQHGLAWRGVSQHGLAWHGPAQPALTAASYRRRERRQATPVPGMRTVFVRRPVVLRVTRNGPPPTEADRPRFEAVTRKGPTRLLFRKKRAMPQPFVSVVVPAGSVVSQGHSAGLSSSNDGPCRHGSRCHRS